MLCISAIQLSSILAGPPTSLPSISFPTILACYVLWENATLWLRTSAMASSQGWILPITAISPTLTGTKLDQSFSSSTKSEQTTDSSTYLQRLRAGISSDTITVPSGSPYIEIPYEAYDEDDARTISPRRGSEEIEIMCEQARKALDMWATLSPKSNMRVD